MANETSAHEAFKKQIVDYLIQCKKEMDARGCGPWSISMKCEVDKDGKCEGVYTVRPNPGTVIQ